MFNNLKVGSRLFLLIAFAIAISVVVAAFGILGMKKMSAETDLMYKENNERSAGLAHLGRIDTNINALSGDIFRAFQHDPSLEISKIHNSHTVTEHLDMAEQRLKGINESWAFYTATPAAAEEKQLVSEFNEVYARFVNETIRPTLDSIRANDYSNAVVERFIRGYRNHGLVLEKDARGLIDANDKLSLRNFDHATETYNASRTYMLIAFAAGLVVCVFIGWRIIRSIVAPLSDLQMAMGEVERGGDFTRRVDVSGSDEVGQTSASFNQLLTVLQKTLSEILGHTNRLDGAASELSTTAQLVAKSSELSCESSSVMAAAVEEMTVSITHISQNAQETSEITQHTGEVSQQGGDIIRQTVDEMHAMAEAVRVSSESIAELGRHSEQISGIVQVIKDVADQTNLLALNAAIEAARAGEQGRGFAVVADEVRKLAERTASATGEIGSMIAAIQDSSGSAVKAMGNVAGRVQSGVTLADQAGVAITDIQDGSQKVKTHVGDITSVLAEQGISSETIARQVERVAQAAEENSAAARSSSEAAMNIEQMARAVRDAVAKFKVA